MLALIGARFLTSNRGRYTCAIGWRSVLGMRCLHISLRLPRDPGEHRLLKYLEKCAGVLKSHRVTTLCFRRDFPWKENLLDLGFRRADSTALLSATAGEIVLRASGNHGRVFVCCVTAGADEAEALAFACEHFRYVAVMAPEPVRDRLGCIAGEYGVSLEFTPHEGLIRADAAVFFAMPEHDICLDYKCRTLFVTDRRPSAVHGGRMISHIRFDFPEIASFDLPDGYPATELISHAMESGLISAKPRVISAE